MSSNPFRILLLGCQGQVGWALQRSLTALGQVTALNRTNGDLTQIEALGETIRRIQPHVIVNAAAYTAVDKAESEPELAHLINAAAPAFLAQEAQKWGAWLIHYSTDYCFNGQGTQPWQETDATDPINLYGQTKLKGEQGIQQRHDRFVIFRTSWVYGLMGQNFAKTMFRLASSRDTLSVVGDQWGVPTSADLLADVTALLVYRLRQNQVTIDESGLYHVAPSGETNWHEYAKFVLHHAIQMGCSLKVQPADVRAIASSEYLTPAQRPINSRLDTRKLQNWLQIELPSWQQGVGVLMQQWLSLTNLR